MPCSSSLHVSWGKTSICSQRRRVCVWCCFRYTTGNTQWLTIRGAHALTLSLHITSHYNLLGIPSALVHVSISHIAYSLWYGSLLIKRCVNNAWPRCDWNVEHSITLFLWVVPIWRHQGLVNFALFCTVPLTPKSSEVVIITVIHKILQLYAHNDTHHSRFMVLSHCEFVKSWGFCFFSSSTLREKKVLNVCLLF